MIFFNTQIDRVYQYLFVGSIFLLPLTVLGNNIFIWVTVLIWLFSGNYIYKIQSIKENNLALASIAFFIMHLIGLLWTEDFFWGLEMTRKMLPFLFILPIFLTISRKENIKYYLFAFFIAMAISEALSYLVWFEVLEPFGKATHQEPTPVMGHISYNPFLAFAIYLVVHQLLFDKSISRLMRTTYTFFAITMTFNMFITGGRAGQVMFFVSLIILSFQFFKDSQVKASLMAIFLVTVIALGGYNYSGMFKERVQAITYDLEKFSYDPDTSMGHRIVFIQNPLELIKSSPFFGVGTGDYPVEYKKVNQANTPKSRDTSHPHNMYLYVQSQLGIVGLISFFWIFYSQFNFALKSKDEFVKHVGVSLPLLFLVIMLSDSYLLGHYTSNLFVLFSAFIYSNK